MCVKKKKKCSESVCILRKHRTERTKIWLFIFCLVVVLFSGFSMGLVIKRKVTKKEKKNHCRAVGLFSPLYTSIFDLFLCGVCFFSMKNDSLVFVRYNKKTKVHFRVFSLWVFFGFLIVVSYRKQLRDRLFCFILFPLVFFVYKIF